MQELHVKSLLPVRLDKYLMEQYPHLGLGRLNKALRENKIKLNGKKQPLSTRVQNGDTIRVYLLDDQLGLTPSDGPEFLSARSGADIIYENSDLMVVNKPAGIPVDGPEADTLLKRVFRRLYEESRYDAAQEPRLCHRLDTGTSGLVLLAKNAEAEHFLTDAIKNRQIRKTYLCVTFGRPVPPAATLHGFLTKDSLHGVVRVLEAPKSGAKEIITAYDTIAVSGRLALLKVDLITGRTHQIRAHLASIGCPILGDSKYGNNAANRELKCKYQALCAWELAFPKKIANPRFSAMAGKTFYVPKPWYYQQILDGTLR
ncbi:MAG: RluA family pseudouridine synthase [Gemmiger sp.]|uniref:RluA family pseudouridine synthase n=1 Tax=Gemmiger sp. TaxID=2049027 RepID=UPI002E75BC59|nr:RluA family pseudouridine synthase [Gemmiger sp.]MEE0801725.1 RluA family pseudouridine synthase [Gemmiger sp.]